MADQNNMMSYIVVEPTAVIVPVERSFEAPDGADATSFQGSSDLLPLSLRERGWGEGAMRYFGENLPSPWPSSGGRGNYKVPINRGSLTQFQTQYLSNTPGIWVKPRILSLR